VVSNAPARPKGGGEGGRGLFSFFGRRKKGSKGNALQATFDTLQA
jgi:hypothetical protein